MAAMMLAASARASAIFDSDSRSTDARAQRGMDARKSGQMLNLRDSESRVARLADKELDTADDLRSNDDRSAKDRSMSSLGRLPQECTWSSPE